MRLEYLQYLLDFAETDSVSTTASRNYMSEQGIRRIFQQMEKESGVVLFRREGRTIRLTEAGERVAAKAKNVISEYRGVQDLFDVYAGLNSAYEDELTVYLTPCTALCILPILDLQMPNLFQFSVNIRETELDYFALTPNPVQNGSAMAIVTVPPHEWGQSALKDIKDKGLVYKPLLSSTVIALVSASSPFAQMEYLPENRYEKRSNSSIGVACPYDAAVINQLEDTVREENIRTITSNIQVIKRQIRRGQVSMFLPKLILASMEIGKGIAWLPLKPKDGRVPSVEFGLLLPAESKRSANVNQVIEYIDIFFCDQMRRPEFSELVDSLIEGCPE